MKPSLREGDDERGAVLVLVALAMTALLGMAAVVVDLGQLRADRRANKAVADMSVRAGLGVLQLGPWSGVCRARDYVLANADGFSSFDAGSEQWFQLSQPLNRLSSSPCLNTTSSPFVDACLPGQLGVPNTSTWGRFIATADGGRFTVEIQSGYAVPDPRFPEDSLATVDTGDPLKGSCDNLVVVITERRAPLFARAIGGGDSTTTIRSVGRWSNVSTEEYSPALLLLERQGCNVLEVSSNNARVIAQPYLDHPGVIQVDSANRSGCSSNQAVLNGAATSSGPSIVVCSARTIAPTPGCNIAAGNKPSRIGMYGLNFNPTGANLTTPYPGTYGDTQAVRSSRSGREPLDRLYRSNVAALDAEARAVLTGNSGMPPGCTAVVHSTCTGDGRTWLVLQAADCSTLGTFFDPVLFPGRTAARNIWFNCDLTVGAPLALSAPDSYVVVTGSIQVNSTFALLDPRTVFVGGRSGGNNVGFQVGNSGNFNVNNKLGTADCPVPDGTVKATRMVVGSGSLNMSSGGVAHLCQTFVFMANGYGKVPLADGTPPCTCTSGYTGTVSVGSGAIVDWTAPDQVPDRRPTAEELELGGRSPYESLGLWTEAGGAQSISGGGTSHMTGIFFLGNANAFTLAGGSSGNVSLSAQFITRRMKVTGGATVNLVLDPTDAVPVVVNDMVLVR
ncbi:MAG: Tad domain-containing protein [Actinobacteria bacterium]|nr:Tad domain-containing protein [Actinomycetota bacterium]